MNSELAPAIAALERRLTDAERKANEIRAAINVLCEEAGMAPRFPNIGENNATTLTQIKGDTFYGKKQMTAIREYLEMRKAQGLGPASPREIYDALRQGGHTFETKDDNIALIGLRALLRKANTVFHKLPNTGAYGLMSWYPNARAAKLADGEDGTADGAETKPEPKAKGGKTKVKLKSKTTAGAEPVSGEKKVDAA